MHIKFLNRGTGSARSAKEYLLQEHDHTGKARESVEVLRGNPEYVTDLADSLKFKHRYRSAVIAWHPDDKPTPEQVNEVLDAFERVAFAGLQPDQYTYYAVMHDNDHIHIITPRVELKTGNAMNIAPPGWEKTYDLIRDKFNVKYDWARPDDLSRKRLVNNSINIHADLKANEAKKMINDTVSELVTAGKLQNRDDIRTYLAKFGEITREGRDYISLKPEGFKKAFKLKGAVYEREFKLDRLVQEVRTEQREGAARSGADREREVSRIESVIEKVVGERAEYTRSRYSRKTHQPEKSSIKDQKADLQRAERRVETDRRGSIESSTELKPSQTPSLDRTSYCWDITDDRIIGWAMGIGRSHIRPHSNAPSPQQADRGSQREQSKDQTISSSGKSVPERIGASQGLQTENMADRPGNMVCGDQGVDNDRIRETIEERIRAAKRAIQSGVAEDHQSIRSQLTEDQQKISESSQRSAGHHRSAEPNAQQIRGTINELADQFRRSAGAELDEASKRVRKLNQLYGQGLRDIGKWFGEIAREIVTKVKEIIPKRQRSKNNSFGMRR